MITFDSFIKLYTGLVTDFDNAYGTQCMDLMHFYKWLCLGIEDKTTLSAPTAYQAWLLNYPQYFQKIPNGLTNFPVKGDIVFWNTKVGSAGHVAICISADVNSLTTFDANWPVGSLPHVQKHDNYFGVAGWLHPIMPTQQPNTDLINSVIGVINNSNLSLINQIRTLVK